jgi:hypothetical protein
LPSTVAGAAQQFRLQPKQMAVLAKTPDFLMSPLADVRPAQFGFYYSLSSALSLLGTEEIQGRAEDLHRTWHGVLGHFALTPLSGSQISESQVGAIRVTQLSDQYYSDQEIACIKQWLDMEPDSSIDLAPLDSQEFNRALSDLTRALKLIEKGLPDFYQEMQASTREIILAKPSGLQKMTFGGVSSFALWGALCLNIEAHQDWRAYIPSLIHEYSHNILFAKAMHSPLVNNDPDARYFSPLRGAMRPMDGIYHAAFVSAREVLAATRLLQQADLLIEDDLGSYFQTVKAHSYQAFEDCVMCLDTDGQLTDLGLKILENTKNIMRTTHIDLVN